MAAQQLRMSIFQWLRRSAVGWACSFSAMVLDVPAAHAQRSPGPMQSPFDYSDLDGPTIVLVLVVMGALAGLIVYLTPSKRSGASEADQAFWQGLSQAGESYLGVLYEDAGVHNTGWTANWYNVRRITVTLKHKDRARDATVHNEDMVHFVWDLFPRIDRAAALARWLETAEARGLPAVYRRKGKLQALSPDQLQAALSDPAAFSAVFLKHLLLGKPLPEGKIEDPT